MSSSNLRVRRNMSVMWIAAAVALLLAARTVPTMSASPEQTLTAGPAETTVVATVAGEDAESEPGR